MAYRLTKTGARVYVPAVQAVAAVPARCVTYERTVAQRTLVNGTDFGQNAPREVPDNPPNYLIVQGQGIGVGDDATYVFDLGGRSGGGGGGGRSGRGNNVDPIYETTYVTEYETVCYPAVEAVEGQPARFVSETEGWYGGANSVPLLEGDGYVSFQLSPLLVGAVVGLAKSNLGTDINEAEHAFYVSGDTARVIENGVVKSTTVVDLESVPTFYISRQDGVVRYSISGTSFVYTSENPSVGARTLDAALYANGDYVENPVIGDFAAPAATLTTGLGLRGRTRRYRYEAPGVLIGYTDEPYEVAAYTKLGLRTRARVALDGTFYERVSSGLGLAASALVSAVYELNLSVPLGIAGSIEAGYHNTVLPPWRMLAGDYDYTSVESDLPAWECDSGSGLPPPVIPRITAVTPPWVLGSVMYSGYIATVDEDLPAWEMRASDYNYTDVEAAIPAWYMYAYDRREAEGYQSWLEPVWVVGWWITPARVFAFFTSDLYMADEITATIVITADIMDGLGLEDEWDLARVLFRAIECGLVLSSAATDEEIEAIQYALNLSTTGVSRYTGFNFSGFCSTDTQSFGWDAAGLYLIRPGDDDGVGIDAQVDFGQQDLGVMQSKHIDTLYLGVSTDGQVYARLRGDQGAERYYRVRQRNRSARIDTAKGTTARQWNVVLEVVDASAFELDTVEFVISVSSRRWVR